MQHNNQSAGLKTKSTLQSEATKTTASNSSGNERSLLRNNLLSSSNDNIDKNLTTANKLCNISNRKRAANGKRARRLCLLLAFALIVFVPRPPNPNLSGWLSSFRLTATKTTSTSSQTIGSLDSAALALKKINIGPGGDASSINHEQSERQGQLLVGKTKFCSAPSFVLPANAFYLDQVGEISRVLGEFVDVLLEKVSFLAEIIIESSLEEECLFSIDSLRNDSSCAAAAASGGGDGGENLLLTSSSSSSSSGNKNLHHANERLNHLVGERINFDELEYTNVKIFKDSIMTANSDSLGTSKCRLFSLSVQTDDLPMRDMDSCCGSYATCYSTCGKEKLHCDQEFRLCLRQMCKSKFDHTNPEIVAKYLSSRRTERSHYEPLAEEVDERIPMDEEEEENDDDKDDLYSKDEQDDDSNLYSGSKTAGEDENDENGGDNSDNSDSRNNRMRSAKTTATATKPTSKSPRKLNDSEVKSLKDKYKACKLASKVMVIGNLAFGCQIYKQSQSLACCNQLAAAAEASIAAPTTNSV